MLKWPVCLLLLHNLILILPTINMKTYLWLPNNIETDLNKYGSPLIMEIPEMYSLYYSNIKITNGIENFDTKLIRYKLYEGNYYIR